MLGFPFHWKGLNTCLLDLRQCKTLQFCVFRGCEFLGWKELEFSGIKFGYIAATYTSAIQLTFTKELTKDQALFQEASAHDLVYPCRRPKKTGLVTTSL